jgi:hypothetical protein
MKKWMGSAVVVLVAIALPAAAAETAGREQKVAVATPPMINPATVTVTGKITWTFAKGVEFRGPLNCTGFVARAYLLDLEFGKAPATGAGASGSCSYVLPNMPVAGMKNPAGTKILNINVSYTPCKTPGKTPLFDCFGDVVPSLTPEPGVIKKDVVVAFKPFAF